MRKAECGKGKAHRILAELKGRCQVSGVSSENVRAGLKPETHARRRFHHARYLGRFEH